jgi:hypothetical protein
LLQRKLRDEKAAKDKLIREINNIEDEKNKVGRYVLAIFAFVFIAAATLLAVVILSAN